LHFDEIIAPQMMRLIGNKGMPVMGQPGHFGSLIVKFDIQFPEELSFANKSRIV
jgi:DnaJ family protein B protein 4